MRDNKCSEGAISAKHHSGVVDDSSGQDAGRALKKKTSDDALNNAEQKESHPSSCVQHTRYSQHIIAAIYSLCLVALIALLVVVYFHKHRSVDNDLLMTMQTENNNFDDSSDTCKSEGNGNVKMDSAYVHEERQGGVAAHHDRNVHKLMTSETIPLDMVSIDDIVAALSAPSSYLSKNFRDVSIVRADHTDGENNGTDEAKLLKYGWKLSSSSSSSSSFPQHVSDSSMSKHTCSLVEFWNVTHLQMRGLQNTTIHLHDVVNTLMHERGASINNNSVIIPAEKKTFIVGSTAASNLITKCAGEQVVNCAIEPSHNGNNNNSNSRVEDQETSLSSLSTNSSADTVPSFPISCASHSSIVAPCSHSLKRDTTIDSSIELVDDPITTPVLGGFGSLAYVTAKYPSLHVMARGRIGNIQSFDEAVRASLEDAFPTKKVGLAGIVFINENNNNEYKNASSDIHYHAQPGFPHDVDIQLDEMLDWLTYWDFSFQVSCATR